ncbi:hypothetical protein JCM8547_003789 [Rhodosporidiobolus lusitaniae]
MTPPHLPVIVLVLVDNELADFRSDPLEPGSPQVLLSAALVCREWSAVFRELLRSKPFLVGDFALGRWLSRVNPSTPYTVHVYNSFLDDSSRANAQGLSALFSSCKGVKRVDGIINFAFDVAVFINPGLPDLESLYLPSHLHCQDPSRLHFPFHLRNLEMVSVKQTTPVYLPAILEASRITLVSFKTSAIFEGADRVLGTFFRHCKNLDHLTLAQPFPAAKTFLPSSLRILSIWRHALRDISLEELAIIVKPLHNLRFLILHAGKSYQPSVLDKVDGGKELLQAYMQNKTAVIVKASSHCM